MSEKPSPSYKVQFRDHSFGPFQDANEWDTWDCCIGVICDVFKQSYCREVRVVDTEGNVVAATNQTGAPKVA